MAVASLYVLQHPDVPDSILMYVAPYGQVREMLDIRSVPAGTIVGEYEIRSTELGELVALAREKGLERATREMVFASLEQMYHDMCKDPELVLKTAVSNYARMQVTLRKLALDTEGLEAIGAQSEVLRSNFTYALSVATRTVGVFLWALQTGLPTYCVPSERKIRRTLETARHLIVDGHPMPYASQFIDDDEKDDLLVNIIMGFNIGMMMAAIVVTSSLGRHDVELDETEIHELEKMLRDWSQETVAQMLLISTLRERSAGLQVEGIPLSAEDMPDNW